MSDCDEKSSWMKIGAGVAVAVAVGDGGKGVFVGRDVGLAALAVWTTIVDANSSGEGPLGWQAEDVKTNNMINANNFL
jgi:hypothetical protein